METRASTEPAANFRVEHQCFGEFVEGAGKRVAWVSYGFWGHNPLNTPRRAEGFDLAWLAAGL